MTYRKPRNDLLARLGGREYRSGGIEPDGTVQLYHDGIAPPADPLFTKHPHADVWVRTVRAEECDRVVQVTTIARYGRYYCQVDDIAEDGTAELYFVRDEAGRGSPPAGFTQVGQGEYRGTAPVRDLYDYHETHRDLLFDHWRATTFGAGSQVRP